MVNPSMTASISRAVTGSKWRSSAVLLPRIQA